MKRNRTLALLAALLAVLLALVLADRHRPTTEEQQHTRDRILPDFARDKATTLELARRDGRVVQLVRDASGWWLLEPRARADDDRVESLLAVLEFGRIERRVGQGDRKQFGLDPPQVTLRVQDHTILVGGDAAGGVYVARDHEAEILVAEHRLVETAAIDPELWLSTRLTTTDPSTARQIGYDGWTLSRERVWRVTRPVVVRADAAKADALVDSLARARGHHRTDVATAAPVSLTLDGREAAAIGGPCAGEPQGVVVSRADAVNLCFAASDLDRLRAPVTALYERRLFPLALDDVRGLDVAVGDRVLSLRRAQGVWRVTAPLAQAGPASDEKVRAWVQRLLDLSAHEFPPRAPSGEIVRVRLDDGDQAIAAALSASAGVGLARREGETLSLEIDPETVTALRSLDAAQLR